MEEQLKEEIPLCTLVHPRAKYSFFAAAALKPIPCGLIAALSLLLVPLWIATLVILQNTHVALQAFKMWFIVIKVSILLPDFSIYVESLEPFELGHREPVWIVYLDFSSQLA